MTMSTPIIPQFINEEVPSIHGYPGNYQRPKRIGVQIDALAKIFHLDPSHALDFSKNLPRLPEGFGWFAIPRWQNIAQTYDEAVECMLKAIASARKFTEYTVDHNCLRQSQRTVEMFKKIGEAQHGDILVIAGQFGLRHRGRSPRRAQVLFKPNEFGLGFFAIGCMLCTHPERLEKYEDLFLDCVGDEYNCPDNGAPFNSVLCFGFRGRRVKVGIHLASDANNHFGASSGWFLQ